MNISYRAKLTEQDIRAGLKIRQFQKQLKIGVHAWIVLIIPPAICVAVIYWIWGLLLEFYVLAFCFGIALPVTVFFFTKHQMFENAVKAIVQASPACKEEVEVTINEDAMCERTPSHEIVCRWDSVEHVAEDEEYFVIWGAPEEQWFMVLKRHLSALQIGDLYKFLSSSGALCRAGRRMRRETE